MDFCNLWKIIITKTSENIGLTYFFFSALTAWSSPPGVLSMRSQISASSLLLWSQFSISRSSSTVSSILRPTSVASGSSVRPRASPAAPTRLCIRLKAMLEVAGACPGPPSQCLYCFYLFVLPRTEVVVCRGSTTGSTSPPLAASKHKHSLPPSSLR